MRVRSLAIAFALTLALSVGAANAGVVLSFNDLTDTPSVTVAGGSVNVVMLTPQDFLAILPAGTLVPGASGSVPGNFNDVYGLTTSGPGYSDLVYFMPVPGSTSLIVEFIAAGSNAGGLTPASGSNLYGTAQATGSLQNIPLPSDLSSLSGSLTVLVAGSPPTGGGSPPAVPEPSTLALAGVSGLVGLGLWVRRRRKA